MAQQNTVMVFPVLKETQRAKALILWCPKKLAARFPTEAASPVVLGRQCWWRGLLAMTVGRLMAGVLVEDL